MKISEMNKEELYNYMRASREWNRYDSTSATWKRAFQLAKQSGLENMDMSCGSCIDKVRKFMERK
jgi:hypothetical protein